MAEDLLGAGLDIDGWSFIKNEQGRTVADLVDKSYTHRQQVPLLMRSAMKKDQHRDVMEVVISALDAKTTVDPPWLELVQRLMNVSDESARQYVDQVEWTSLARLGTDPNDTAIRGFISSNHPNFTEIVKAVYRRTPAESLSHYTQLDEAILYGLPIDYRGDKCPWATGASIEELAMADAIGFWLGVVLQACIGSFGLVCNLLAIYILLTSKRLKSIFNFILVLYFVTESLYITSTLLIELYKVASSKESPLFHHVFSSFLYPLKPMLVHTATFLTVLMARERYKAIQHPLEYRSASLKSNAWMKALGFLTLSAGMSSLFVLPLFWESRVAEVKVSDRLASNASEGPQPTTVGYELQITDFRYNELYIIYYKNLATFIVTLFLPLLLLFYYNGNTYLLMHKRKREPSRQNTVNIAQRLKQQMHSIKKEEERKANLLFVIIIIFMACNTLRFFLNFEECVAMRDYRRAVEANCNLHPFWALVMNHCSSLLLCFNASIGFGIYCVMSSDFRAELKARFEQQ